jgi:hypothetical protein
MDAGGWVAFRREQPCVNGKIGHGIRLG